MSIYRGCEAGVVTSVSVTVVTAGPANTGKTSLITRFTQDNFNEVTLLYNFEQMINHYFVCGGHDESEPN